jgi:hypothetical protein
MAWVFIISRGDRKPHAGAIPPAPQPQGAAARSADMSARTPSVGTAQAADR